MRARQLQPALAGRCGEWFTRAGKNLGDRVLSTYWATAEGGGGGLGLVRVRVTTVELCY